ALSRSPCHRRTSPPGAAAASASAGTPSSDRPSRLPERGAPLDVGRVDHPTVALDVAVLAADDEQHQVVVAGVGDLSPGGRLDVHESAGPELARLAVDLDARPSAVDEVELVLQVVVVVEAVIPRRHHDHIDAEGGHAECA